MLQFNPGQLYFLGREASDRLHQVSKLGIEGGDHAFDLTLKTVQFHVDAMTRLMTQTNHVKDIGGVKQLWSELFGLMRENIKTGNAAQKQTVEMALKATDLFYSNIFTQSAATEAKSESNSSTKNPRSKK